MQATSPPTETKKKKSEAQASSDSREKPLAAARLIEAEQLTSLGDICSNQGETSMAILHYEEAKKIIIQKLGDIHPFLATICRKLGPIYQYESIRAYKETMRILESKPTAREKRLETPVASMKDTDLFATTLATSSSTLLIAQNALAAARLIEAKLLISEGDTWSDRGKDDRAISLYIEAKIIIIQNFGDTHPFLTTICKRLAAIYQYKAIREYQKTMRILLRSKAENEEEISNIKKLLSKIYVRPATSQQD